MATGLKHELYLGGWVDVTGDVSGSTTVDVGAPGGASLNPGGTCAFTIIDTDGSWAPRNPSGTYYGVIGRNTPHRCSVDAAENYLRIPGGSAGDNASSTPDSASLSITGDIEVWVDVTLKSWRTSTAIMSKWISAGGNRSWVIHPNDDGTITWYWSDDGSTTYTETSTAVVPIETGRLTIKITMDVDDGSGNHVVTFYTADSVGGSTTQLGDAVTTSGTTSIYDGNAVLAVGDGATGGRFVGRVHEAAVYDGIGGSLVADPDFTAQTAGAATFDDGQGNTWTQNGVAEISDREYLWHGEISDWPRQRDVSGDLVTMSLTSRPISDRYLTGDGPKFSSVYRGFAVREAQYPSAVAYWPCEDSSSATSLAAGLSFSKSMNYLGSPSLASNSNFSGSGSILTMKSGVGLWSGIPAYSGTGEIQVQHLLSMPAAGVTTQRLLKLVCSGTAVTWHLNIDSSGNLQLTAYDSAGAGILSDGYYAFGLNGKDVRVGLNLTQNGADVDYDFNTIDADLVSGGVVSGTLVGYTIGTASMLTIGPDTELVDVGVGHIVVRSEVSDFWDGVSDITGHAAETAGARFVRVLGEEGALARVYGDSGRSAPLGPQQTGSVADIVKLAADSDGGQIFTMPDELGLGLAVRSRRTGLGAVLTLDYSAADLSAWRPVDDLELVVNELTLTRETGSTAVGSIDTGVLGTQDRPDGAGRIPSSSTVSLVDDAALSGQLSWRLHLGTVDAPREPGLGIELARDSFSAAADRAAALGVRIGDRIDVTNQPVEDYQYGDLALSVVGMRHVVDHFTHRISYRCWPYEGFRVGIWHRYGVASGVGTADRWSGEGTVIAEDLDTTETGVDITVPSFCEWAHDDGDYDVRVNGEVMTVTGISGSHPSYTLTVTRSVNGVVATHSNGDAIDLNNSNYWGL